MTGCVEGIRRGLVLCLLIIAGTAIEQAYSVGSLCTGVNEVVNLVLDIMFAVC